MRRQRDPCHEHSSLAGRSVSAVIPTFNRKALVLRALRSVYEQTQSVDEIIVVDDGSEDGTRAAIRDEFPAVEILVQDNRGVSAARNRGIAVASGSWIAFLDSDDEWKPSKIERQLGALAQQPSRCLAHTDEIWIRRGKRVNPKLKHAKPLQF